MTMKRTITLITVLALVGCPTDDVPSADSSTATGSSDDPDLPGDGDGDPSTTTESTGDGDPTGPGDGDGEPTTGDGDGDPTTTGDGDGDGDGDTGSETEPTSLIVESDGLRIGYLMGVWDYGFHVWDDVNEVTFNINQVTGYVVSAQVGIYYATANCTGQRYANAGVPNELCDAVGPPVRRYVYGDGESNSGHNQAMSIASTSGEPALVNIQSLKSGVNCVAFAVEYCAMPIQTTNVIPTAFPLPITVAEALP
jgi:hypothetical protein